MFEVAKVVIKGEMPESCINTDDLDSSCKFLKIGGEYWCYATSLPIRPFDPLIERPDWCPLVPESEGE